MKPATIHVKASQLLDRDKVTVRLEEVRESRLKRHEVTVDRIVAELEKIAFANADDFFAWGPTGVVIKASDELTPEQRIFSARSPPYKPRLARGLVSFIFSQRQYAIVCGATIRMRLAPGVDCRRSGSALPPSAHPRRQSHPDCRSRLILIVAPHVTLFIWPSPVVVSIV